MASNAVISVICHDRGGLVADIAGLLYGLNVNLSDTTFAVLGEAAEFTAIAEIPGDLALDALRREMEALVAGEGAQVTVAAFDMRPVHDDSGRITHRIEVAGRDRPGIVARLSEAFGQFGGNIVRMNSERVPGEGHDRYVTRFSVYLPERRADACLATVANTAGELRMTFRYETAAD